MKPIVERVFEKLDKVLIHALLLYQAQAHAKAELRDDGGDWLKWEYWYTRLERWWKNRNWHRMLTRELLRSRREGQCAIRTASAHSAS